jgi:hypothetical protein
LGILQKYPNILCSIGGALGKLLPSSSPDISNTSDGSGIGAANSGSDFGGDTSMPAPEPDITSGDVIDQSSPFDFSNMAARGGLIRARSGGAIGCASTRYRGGLPRSQ